MDESITEGGTDVTDTKYTFSFSHLRPKADDLLFLPASEVPFLQATSRFSHQKETMEEGGAMGHFHQQVMSLQSQARFKTLHQVSGHW